MFPPDGQLYASPCATGAGGRVPPPHGFTVEVSGDFSGRGVWSFEQRGAWELAVIGVLRRLSPAYGAYVLAALALPLSFPVSPQPLMSLPRFLAVLFPLLMWLGWWTSRGGRIRLWSVLAGFSAALIVFTAQFATWQWVA